MRLSFVIPTRNQASFIASCIESCIAQGVSGSEIIVIDGASTDGTVEVVRGFGDRVRLVSEPDRGQSDAINKGIRLAKGETIAWINSDDYYAGPEALSPLLSALAADPSLDIVYGDGLRVNQRGAVLGPHRGRAIARVAEIVTHPASFVCQPALLFRRQLFLDAGGLDETLHYTMDYELWIRLFQQARAHRYLPTVVACARYHDDAKSVAGMGRQVKEAYRVKRAAADRLGLSTRDRLRMHAGVAALGAYFLATRLGLRRDT